MKARLQSFWRFVRELATDDAYERYLQHHRHTHEDCAPLGRRAFYLRQQQNKWSGVQRCC
ncbi:MAG TPA: YbdD/YjiX family protein [Povalibacter sp.]|uniref:YbdD/YjiX family protein n=1 Tax=Povalibacter sp. TaxID=1962978 RepID=UPI002B598F5E|nr:YbdD/YjiX family protein [Povalibacter sp.]HMN45298.1 YbdD/YjiX family protein [Povalibacter sp.]